MKLKYTSVQNLVHSFIRNEDGPFSLYAWERHPDIMRDYHLFKDGDKAQERSGNFIIAVEEAKSNEEYINVTINNKGRTRKTSAIIEITRTEGWIPLFSNPEMYRQLKFKFYVYYPLE